MITEKIDQLITNLEKLKTKIIIEKRFCKEISAVTKSFDELNSSLISMDVDDLSAEMITYIDDPIPDRIRSALINVIENCSSDITDREITYRILGLLDDGQSETLQNIALGSGLIN